MASRRSTLSSDGDSDLSENIPKVIQRLFRNRTALLLSIYFIMVLRWGYEFGRNDQMQTLAYAHLLAYPDSYPHDFYLQGVHAHVPNERFAFSWLLSLAPDHLFLVSLIGHVLFSLLLLHYMERIASLFIRRAWLRWLALLVLFIPLYGVNLGGNELWYNSFFVSNVVKTVGMAALWWLLNGHFQRAMLVACVLPLLQPVVGIQLYGLISATTFSLLVCQSNFLRSKGVANISGFSSRAVQTIHWRDWIGWNALWWISGGLWILFLHFYFEEVPVPEPDRFFDILFRFRAPHHYWPPSWSLRSWLVEGGILLFGLLYFARTNRMLFHWFAWSLLACVLYLVGMVWLQWTEIGALQGFKVSIWLEFLGVVALFGAAEPILVYLVPEALQRHSQAILLSLGLIAGGILGFAAPRIPWQVPFDFNPECRNDPAVNISREAKHISGPDALFLHPIGFTELKVYGERSSYVDYKVLVHTRAAMHEWYRRIGVLYKCGLEDGSPASERYTKADEAFANLTPDELDLLAAEGATHLLTYRSVSLPYPVLAENAEWVIYDLKQEGP